MRKGPTVMVGPFPIHVVSGRVLLSHTVSRAVPSALEGLTSGLGMGPGVSPPPKPPKRLTPPPSRARKSLVSEPQRPRILLSRPHQPPLVRGAGWFLGTAQGREHHAVTATWCVLKSLGLLVPVNSTPHDASISGLSTQ